MASERQIAANRANARRSTGPKSGAGKTRASRNANRHGLTASTPVDANWIEKVEKLASEIVGSTTVPIDLAHARTVAHVELEVQRVRAAVTAAIVQIVAGGGDEGWSAAFAIRGKGAPPLPPEEGTERVAEAIRHAFPILRVLDRYERRAIARRDKVIRACIET